MKSWALHLALIAVLFTAQFWLSPYHATNLARIMVLAVFAMGYNLAFGYTGLLSLGHALFFGAGPVRRRTPLVRALPGAPPRHGNASMPPSRCTCRGSRRSGRPITMAA